MTSVARCLLVLLTSASAGAADMDRADLAARVDYLESYYTAGDVSMNEVLKARLELFKLELRRAESAAARVAVHRKEVKALKRLAKIERRAIRAGSERSKQRPPAAQAALDKAIDRLDGVLAARKHRWQVLKPVKLELPEGDNATTLGDGSVLFAMPGPRGSESRLVFEPGGQPITHLRFEALNHKSLPSGGPGRSADGTFLLYALELYHLTQDDRIGDYIEIKQAWADQQSEVREIENAVDFISNTCWIAPSSDHPHAPVTAVLELDKPLHLKPDERLAIKLDVGHNDHRTPGRVRISIAGPDALEREQPSARARKQNKQPALPSLGKPVFEHRFYVEYMRPNGVVATLSEEGEGKFKATIFPKYIVIEPDGDGDSYHVLHAQLVNPRMTMGHVSPRNSLRWDAIEEPKDLIPNPSRVRRGIITVGDDKRPAADAQVVIVPISSPSAVALREGRLHSPWEEQWVTTNEQGEFTIAPFEDAYSVAVLHADGFGWFSGPLAESQSELSLQPWSRLELVAEKITDLERGVLVSAGAFSLSGFSPTKRKHTVKVPPGEIAITRTVDVGEGTSIVIANETLRVEAGATKQVNIAPLTAEQRQQAQKLYSDLYGARKPFESAK